MRVRSFGNRKPWFLGALLQNQASLGLEVFHFFSHGIKVTNGWVTDGKSAFHLGMTCSSFCINVRLHTRRDLIDYLSPILYARWGKYVLRKNGEVIRLGGDKAGRQTSNVCWPVAQPRHLQLAQTVGSRSRQVLHQGSLPLRQYRKQHIFHFSTLTRRAIITLDSAHVQIITKETQSTLHPTLPTSKLYHIISSHSQT